MAMLATFSITTLSRSSLADPSPPPPPVEEGGVRWHAGLDKGIGLETDSFRASLGMLSQAAYEVTVDDDVQHGFSLRKARPTLRMGAFDGLLSAFVQPELAGDPRLLDAELGVHLLPELNLRFGQFVTPHSRGFITPVPKLQFIDFGRVESEFRADRDMGLSVEGALFDGDLEYAAGIFNGNGIEPRLGDGYMWVGRLVANPFGPVPYDETLPLTQPESPFRLAVGWNGFGRRRAREEMSTRRDYVTGPDLFIVFRGFTLLAEAFRRFRAEDGHTIDAWGSYVQAGYFVVPRWVEIAGRAGFMDLDINAPNQTQASYEGALNIYPVGNHFKIQLRYVHARGEAVPADPAHRVTVQTQLQL